MIRIILDSSADFLAREYYEKKIEMVPYSVTFGEETYRDGIDISRDDYFDKMISSDLFPQTSQPSPAEYLEHFEEAKKAGDEIICMTLAAALSGSYQSALLAAQMAEYDKIHVVDSRSANGGIQHLANRACEMRDAGCTTAEIVEEIERLRSRVRVYFIVDTLEYLYKGGRLSRIEAASGRVMRIKPLLFLGEKGEIVVKDRCVGTAHAVDALCTHFTEEPPDESFPVYSIYSSGIPNCEKLENQLKQQGIHIDDRRQFGLTIGTHAGPGCAGAAYIKKED